MENDTMQQKSGIPPLELEVDEKVKDKEESKIGS